MQTYSITLPTQQAFLFQEILSELGFAVFLNNQGLLKTSLTIRYDNRADLEAAWELFTERLHKILNK